MDTEEKCPTCGTEQFEVIDYEEDFNNLNDINYKTWKCLCCNCHDFAITYYYTRTKIEVG